MGIRRSRGTGWHYWEAVFNAINEISSYNNGRLTAAIFLTIYFTVGFPYFKLYESIGLSSLMCIIITAITDTVVLLYSCRIYVWAAEADEERPPLIPRKILAFLPSVIPLTIYIIGGTRGLAVFLAWTFPLLYATAMWHYRVLSVALGIVGVTAIAVVCCFHFASYKLLGRTTSTAIVSPLGIKLLDIREGWGSLLVYTNKRQGYPILLERLYANGDTASTLKLSIEAIKKYPDDTEIKDFCRTVFASLTSAPAYAATAKRALADAYAKSQDNPLLLHYHILALQEKGDTTALSEALAKGIASAKQLFDTTAVTNYGKMFDRLYAKQGEKAKYRAYTECSMKSGILDMDSTTAYFRLVTKEKCEPAHVATLGKALRRAIASAMEQQDRATALDCEKMLCKLYLSQGDVGQYNETLKETVKGGQTDADILRQYFNLVANGDAGDGATPALMETLQQFAASAKRQADTATAAACEKMVGELHLSQGDTASYKATIEKLLMQGYYDADIMLGYAKYILNIKKGSDISRPLQDLNAAMDNDPLNPKYILEKAAIFFLAGQYDKALYAIQRVRDVPDEASLYELEGDIYLKLAQRPKQSLHRWERPEKYRREAEFHYEWALNIIPNDKELKRKLNAATK